MELRASAVTDARQIDRFFNQEREGSLSPLGRREAARVAERFASERLDGIYASPLLRARETADVTARALGMDVEITDAIAELKTGHLREESLAGRYVRAMLRAPLRPELKRAVLGSTLIPLYFHAWRRERTVGGETPAMLDARVNGFLAALEARHDAHAHVALFAHGYLIFTLVHSLARSVAERVALWRRPYIPNGSITEMTLERGRLLLRSYADASHLR